MSPLGHFGGSAPPALRHPGGGGASSDGLMEVARDHLIPSPEGMPALSQQLAQYFAGFGNNRLRNGSYESWSLGVTAAPDGWTLSGAGATVARNTTANQIQDGLASCNVTAALNTVTRLSQTLTISTTQNTRLRGQQVVLAKRVLVSTAARVSVELDDGVAAATTSLQHTGSGAFETLAVTITVDSAATQIKCSLLISSGASITATMDAAKLEEGATATAFTLNLGDLLLTPRYVSATGNTTTTSADTALDSMSIANVIVDGQQSVLLLFSCLTGNNTLAAANSFSLKRGSTSLQPSGKIIAHTINVSEDSTMVSQDVNPAAGNYTYSVNWGVTAGSTGSTDSRALALAVVPTL